MGKRYKSKLTPIEAIETWKKMPSKKRKRIVPGRKNKKCYYPKKIWKIRKDTGTRYQSIVWVLDRKCKRELEEKKRKEEAIRRLKKKK